MKRWWVICTLILSCSFGVIAADGEQLWITIGSDKVDAVRADLAAAGFGDALPRVMEEDGVVLSVITEKHVGVLAETIHDQFHRCGGFVVHETYEAAVEALSGPKQPLHKRGVTYTIDSPETVNAMMPGLSEDNIRETIIRLSDFVNRCYNSTHGVSVSDWLVQRWGAYIGERDDVSIRQFSHNGFPMKSVILTIEGGLFPEEVVIVGGHLDSITSGCGSNDVRAPGADDDASGIATFSEVMRVFLESGYKPDRTIEFMAYAAEEVGLRGSQHIAQTYRDDNVDVVGVMQLDMTNYQGSNKDVVIYEDRTSSLQNTFIKDLIDTYTDLNWGTDTCGYGCSDHASWNAQGYRASMPFEAYFHEYNPTIHSTQDLLTVSDNNAENAMKFAQVALAYLVEMGKGGIGCEFSGDEDQDGHGALCDNCPTDPNQDQSDVDQDGVGDVCDNCAAEANADQADGDQDGVGNACDNCAGTANADQADSDQDGIGDACDICPDIANQGQDDNDNDTVGDACDNCVGVANADQADNDGDGFGNACDNCPGVANADQTDSDGDGIGDACRVIATAIDWGSATGDTCGYVNYNIQAMVAVVNGDCQH